jgi:hypothetical protein
MVTERDLTTEMRRVLSALCDFAPRAAVDDVVPLRHIANRTLDGDAQQAARVLAALDAGGFIRTDTMGWHRGWLTQKGRSAGRPE